MSSLFATPELPDAGKAENTETDASGDASSASAVPDQADAFSVPAPVGDIDLDFVVPVPPALPVPPRRRLGAAGVAGVLAGSLVFGLVGGVAGAAAWGQWGPDSNVLPVSVDAGSGPEIEPGTIAAVAAAAMPSVAQIQSINGGVVIATGSAVVIREDGYLLTNNHVIEPSDGTVNVVFSDGTEAAGEVVGGSSDYDLAVVKVDRSGLVPLALGDSDAVSVGDPVIAIGSPLGLDSTVTSGIVSALNRPVTTGDEEATAVFGAVQTDAAINPGNSGGPLINMAGEVIGINSAVAALPGATAETGAGSVGLGFAVPSNQARRVAEELIADGTADVPVIGVLLDRTYTGKGVRVGDSEQMGGPTVIAGTPAAEAGIEEGDIIVAVDGKPVSDPETAVALLRAHELGESVIITIERDGKEIELSLTLVAQDSVDFPTP